MSKIFFTADTHFGHYNIINYCHRPFKDAAEMDEALITGWNDRVQPEDTVYHLGDVAFGEWQTLTPLLERLNGHIILIRGNHEKPAMTYHEKSLEGRVPQRFDSVKDYLEIKVPDPDSLQGGGGTQLITLLHYPMQTWKNSMHGSWHLHGHEHHNIPDDPHLLRLDVGVDGDGYGYAPLSYQEIKLRMAVKKSAMSDISR